MLFLERLSVQLAIAIQQAELIERLNRELEQRKLAEENLRLQAIVQQEWIQKLAKTATLLERRNQELDSLPTICAPPCGGLATLPPGWEKIWPTR